MSLLSFYKVTGDIIDIYADEQTIIFENGVDNYELKFNVVSYSQEIIKFGYSNLILDCKVENNILRCPLTKNDITGYYRYIQEYNELFYFFKQNANFIKFPLIGYINIKLKETQKKKDIFIKIKKLLVDTNGPFSSIAYETNVTDIYNIYLNDQGIFLNFINKDNKGKISEFLAPCSLLKYDSNPLYLVCLTKKEGENRLKEIKEEMRLNY